MLNGAAHANADVELGRDDLARLADLHVVGHVAGVDGRSWRAHRRVHMVGQLVEHLEVVAILQASAARDDHTSADERRPVRLGQLLADEGATRTARHGERERVNAGRCGGTLQLGRLERRAANAEQLDGVFGPHSLDGIAGVDGANERVRLGDADDVRDRLSVEMSSDARQQALAERRAADHDVSEGELLLTLHDHGCEHLGQEALERLAGRHEHFAHARHARHLAGHRRTVATARHNARDRLVLGYFGGGRDGVERDRVHLGIVVLDNHQRVLESL